MASKKKQQPPPKWVWGVTRPGKIYEIVAICDTQERAQKLIDHLDDPTLCVDPFRYVASEEDIEGARPAGMTYTTSDENDTIERLIRELTAQDPWLAHRRDRVARLILERLDSFVRAKDLMTERRAR